MGQALYRKYRSKSLDELVGQEHVTSTLKNAIKQGRISHAYLLSGPRGVGKTSIARILAHEINGLPYDDESHLDIIEIDAASNRRIDEIRDLRDRVNTAPASAKYKVYIIDEVHMLTKEAFNALLKTLEEPPAHVIFILATTEAHKLPETIISRTQRYNLRPIPPELVTKHLKFIAMQEKIEVDDDALELIAQHGDGSFRDSISLLDQASSIDTHVSRNHIESMLGLAPAKYVTQLLEAVQQSSAAGIVSTLSELYSLGYEPAMISTQLGAQIRGQVLDQSAIDPGASLALLRRLLDVPASRQPRQILEITLLQAGLPTQNTPKSAQATVMSKPSTATPTKILSDTKTAENAQSAPKMESETKPKAEDVIKAESKIEPIKNIEAEIKPEEKTPDDTPKEPGTESIDAVALWEQVLDAIKKEHNTLYGVARMATPEFDGDKLNLTFKFAFHQKRMNEAKNRNIITEVAEKLYEKPLEITFKIQEVSSEDSKSDLTNVSNIFGGAELLQ